MELGGLTFDNALLGLIRLLFAAGGLLYFIFAFIVIRQITVMKKTLITPITPEISVLGWLHLLLTGSLFFYFIFGL